MAKLVEIMGVAHDPTLPFMWEAGRLGALQPKYEMIRKKFEEARPDVVLLVSNDHCSTFFMDNMPVFSIGWDSKFDGPFQFEQDLFGLKSYKAPGAPEVAKVLTEALMDNDIDVGYADNYQIDHGYTVPSWIVRPQGDVPIVPIFINVMSPPLARPTRCLKFGQVLRKVIEDMPGNKRVAVVATAHLSFDVGGPRMPGAIDKDWDKLVIDLMGKGDVKRLMQEASYENLMSMKYGNAAPGFVNFIALVGVANGKRATVADVEFYEEFVSHPIVAWDVHKEG